MRLQGLRRLPRCFRRIPIGLMGVPGVFLWISGTFQGFSRDVPVNSTVNFFRNYTERFIVEFLGYFGCVFQGV